MITGNRHPFSTPADPDPDYTLPWDDPIVYLDVIMFGVLGLLEMTAPL